MLNDGRSLLFNGETVKMNHDSVKLTQSMHVENSEKFNENYVDQLSFISQRAGGAYISSVCRPDLTFGLAHASQVLNSDKADARRLNSVEDFAKVQSSSGMSFVPINLYFCRITVFPDTSFEYSTDNTSQIGYVIALVDKANRVNIVHYSSFKAKRVTKIVLSSRFSP